MSIFIKYYFLTYLLYKCSRVCLIIVLIHVFIDSQIAVYGLGQFGFLNVKYLIFHTHTHSITITCNLSQFVFANSHVYCQRECSTQQPIIDKSVRQVDFDWSVSSGLV